MRFARRFVVRAPLEQVFAYLAEPSNVASILTRSARLQPVSDGPVGLGSVFRLSGEDLGGDWIIRVIELQSPRRLVAEFWSEGKYRFVGRGGYELEPVERGTAGRVYGEGQADLATEVATVLLRPFLDWLLDRRHRKIAADIERRVGSHSGSERVKGDWRDGAGSS